MREEERKYSQCPFCGNIFEKDPRACLKGCPLGKTCGMVICPRCRYHFAEESRTVKFFKRILNGKRRAADGHD